MLAFKEFADFISLNKANLAATYARLLAESGEGYENIPDETRLATARKLLKAVIEAYELESSSPLLSLFEKPSDHLQPASGGLSPSRWGSMRFETMRNLHWVSRRPSAPPSSV